MTVRNWVIDLTALPSGFLPLSKRHLRVEHSDDDADLLQMIARAIGRLEGGHGVRINLATYEWLPAAAEFCNGRARVPFTPASAFTATAGGDVSADYSLETDAAPGAVMPQYLRGAYVSGLVLELTAGHATVDEVSFSLQDEILALVAHLYNHREILAPDEMFVLPDRATDAINWMPRV